MSPLAGLLVGYGSIGRRHLTNLHELGVTDWAVVHTGTGTLAFEPPGPVRVHRSLEAALAAERPDFAVIANPSSLHVDTARACAAHGCHLLLEKPVADRLDDVDALRADVARSGSRVLVGFQFRFHPALQRIRDLLAGDAFGRPLAVRVVWGEHLPDWHPWEDWRTGYAARRELGGGVHHTICHPFDYLRMLFGEPERVAGTLSDAHPLGLDVAEGADARLTFPGGLEAVVHLDYWTRPATHRVEITATGGSLVWDFIAGELRLWESDAGSWRTESVPGVAERNDLFVAEAQHLLAVVAGSAEPRCTLEDGITAVRIAEAVERSSATGGGFLPGPGPTA